MHPSISINTLCIQAGSLARHVDTIARIGVGAISPTLEEILEIGAAPAARLIRDAGLEVATFTHRAFGFTSPALAQAQRERLEQTIDMAAQIGARSVTLTTGGRGTLSWRAAAERFAEEIAPCAKKAQEAGVALSVESTSHLYADASIAHRLGDLTTICDLADIGLGIDLFACWFDSDIEDAIAFAVPRCHVVQVSDYMPGDRSLPCRAVPGDGIAQIERLIALIVRAGYHGFFDLEIIGPRIDEEGAVKALTRAKQRLESYIDAA